MSRPPNLEMDSSLSFFEKGIAVMNKTFKTIWNDVRRSYIVTNEAQKSHGKPSKSVVALAVATTAVLFSGLANAAYTTPLNDSYKGDTGYVASSHEEMADAIESWRTEEYLKNWGLDAQKAAVAYALGYHGQGVKVGQMDSGILKTHTELSGDRWHAVSASGEYTHDGERYPQYAYPDSSADTSPYKAGEKFNLDGYYNSEFNDNHGTGCAGVYAGNRDGQGMHGVAWGSEFYSANTGGTDDSNYGPFPDYGFFKAGYDALVDAGVKIINNSWGTNLKQVDENGNILDYYHSGPELTTTKDIEYEYFMFKRNYNEGPSFVDAAWDAVKGKDVIQAFSAGNNDRATPYHRGLYPYFNPEAENQWLVVSGLRQVNKTSDPDNYELEDNFNEVKTPTPSEITSSVEPLTETFAKSAKEHAKEDSSTDVAVDPSPLDLNLSAYNDKETISLKLSSFLFLRQFFASFFQYTTLSLCFPQIASRLGPSYPSSMPFAYLLIGLISGVAAGFTSDINLKTISGGLIFCVFITLSGLSAFRGICTLMCLFSQRRADEIISGAAVAIPCIIFTIIASALAMIVSPLELFLSFAMISMLSAAFAVTLVFTLEQDPVNSIGTITIGGMIISAIITLALCFLTLNPLVMASLLGTGLLVRVLIGYFLHLNHVAASRDLILAATQISVIAMLLDLACIGSSLPIINNCVISLFN